MLPNHLRCTHQVGEIPAHLLTDECPRYELEGEAHALAHVDVSPANAEPKTWIYEQYD